MRIPAYFQLQRLLSNFAMGQLIRYILFTRVSQLFLKWEEHRIYNLKLLSFGSILESQRSQAERFKAFWFSVVTDYRHSQSEVRDFGQQCGKAKFLNFRRRGKRLLFHSP